MAEDQYQGPEKRNYTRIIYKPKERPKLRIKTDVFEVADVSEKGLRFINNKELVLDDCVQGTLTFLNGESVDIEGNVEWKQDDDFGFQLKFLIPSDMILKEQRHIVLNCD